MTEPRSGEEAEEHAGGEAEGHAGGEAEGRRDELPNRISVAARGYNEPPPVPREEIWASIQAARRGTSGGEARETPSAPPPLRPFASRWLRFAVGIAALLAIGIGIGRLTPTLRSGQALRPAAPITALKDRGKVAYSVVTAEHLSRVETLLTSLRTGQDQAPFSAQARELLTSTRLLLDSRAAEDPKIKALLQDLELILVQVGQLDKSSGREELDLLTDGLEQRQVMPRLRNAIPAGPARQL